MKVCRLFDKHINLLGQLLYFRLAPFFLGKATKSRSGLKDQTANPEPNFRTIF